MNSTRIQHEFDTIQHHSTSFNIIQHRTLLFNIGLNFQDLKLHGPLNNIKYS